MSDPGWDRKFFKYSSPTPDTTSSHTQALVSPAARARPRLARTHREHLLASAPEVRGSGLGWSQQQQPDAAWKAQGSHSSPPCFRTFDFQSILPGKEHWARGDCILSPEVLHDCYLVVSWHWEGCFLTGTFSVCAFPPTGTSSGPRRAPEPIKGLSWHLHRAPWGCLKSPKVVFVLQP